ncbi:MAG: SpoVG family protein [Candidatus Omnitrophota bacterium]
MNRLSLEVAGIRKLDTDSKTKAFCDVSVCGTLLVRGFRVVEGKNGTFVGMPRQQGKNGQWYETVTPLNDETKEQLNGVVLEAFRDVHDEMDS